MKNSTKATVGFSAASVIFSIVAAPFTDSLCHPRNTANNCLNQIQGVVLTASSTSIAADNVIWRTPSAGIASIERRPPFGYSLYAPSVASPIGRTVVFEKR